SFALFENTRYGLVQVVVATGRAAQEEEYRKLYASAVGEDEDDHALRPRKIKEQRSKLRHTARSRYHMDINMQEEESETTSAEEDEELPRVPRAKAASREQSEGEREGSGESARLRTRAVSAARTTTRTTTTPSSSSSPVDVVQNNYVGAAAARGRALRSRDVDQEEGAAATEMLTSSSRSGYIPAPSPRRRPAPVAPPPAHEILNSDQHKEPAYAYEGRLRRAGTTGPPASSLVHRDGSRTTSYQQQQTARTTATRGWTSACTLTESADGACFDKEPFAKKVYSSADSSQDRTAVPGIGGTVPWLPQMDMNVDYAKDAQLLSSRRRRGAPTNPLPPPYGYFVQTQDFDGGNWHAAQQLCRHECEQNSNCATYVVVGYDGEVWSGPEWSCKLFTNCYEISSNYDTYDEVRYQCRDPYDGGPRVDHPDHHSFFGNHANRVAERLHENYPRAAGCSAELFAWCVEPWGDEWFWDHGNGICRSKEASSAYSNLYVPVPQTACGPLKSWARAFRDRGVLALDCLSTRHKYEEFVYTICPAEGGVSTFSGDTPIKEYHYWFCSSKQNPQYSTVENGEPCRCQFPNCNRLPPGEEITHCTFPGRKLCRDGATCVLGHQRQSTMGDHFVCRTKL
ncbi:unnamed protein product, partial [Amoebophrya sp. A120]